MITRIHHVGIVVLSLEAALGVYRDRFRLPLTRLQEVPDQGVRVALLAAGEGEIELLEPTRPDTGVARFLDRRGEGMHHLCFESDDVGRELQRLKSLAVRLVDETPRLGAAGRIAFLHPDAAAGILVELATPLEPVALPPAPYHLHHVVVGAEEPPAAGRLYRDLFGMALRDETAAGQGVVATLNGAVFLEFHRPGDCPSGPVEKGLSILALSAHDLAAAEVLRQTVGPGPSESHGVGLVLVDGEGSR